MEGTGAHAAFRNESGGHRWQRVPPNDKRGRVQTSTVTVAVLPEAVETELLLDPRDVEVRTTKGTGPGGQHRNTTESCVVLTHRPSGLTIRVDGERSLHRNKALAFSLLRTRLLEAERASRASAENSLRRAQVGSGMRGDKRRTIRCQDGMVVDHVLGTRMRLERYLKGEVDRLSVAQY